ncbi:MAG: transcription-repair coupling factor [Planctomycetaceae bacterium]|nr:transcription-repair coupling factor [Planctomycetaceae bacterium]
MLKHLTELLLAEKGFMNCLTALQNDRTVVLDGILGSSCALAAAAFASQNTGILLVVLADHDDIEKFIDDLALFSDIKTLAFPAMNDVETPFRVGDELFGDRVRVLKELIAHSNSRSNINSSANPAMETKPLSTIERVLQRRKSGNVDSGRVTGQQVTGQNACCSPMIVVTSIAALLQPVPTPEILQQRTRSLRVGGFLEQSDLTRWLAEGGYHPTPGVELPGEFAVRGSIVDIFAPDWDMPVRVEFFGDEIESIRRFEVAGQRSHETLNDIALTRLRQDETYTGHLSEYLEDREQGTGGRGQEIEKRMQGDNAELNIEEKPTPNSKTSPPLPPSSCTLLFVEPERIEEVGRNYLQRLMYPEKQHTVSEVLRRLMRFPTITASTLARGTGDATWRMAVESVERLHGDLPKIREELLHTEERQLYLVCQTEAEVTRLGEAFAMLPAMRENRLHFLIGRISGGFRLVDHSILVIGTSQLFERTDMRRTRRRQLSQVIDSFTELKPGDYVVHISHGIARYRGLELMTKGMQEEEHLKLEFADEVVLYVPVSKIALVQKYVAGAKSRPKLAKLNGQLWAKQKREVQKAVFDLAVEMIDMQAMRECQPGITFPADSDWQHEFDAAFPYRETDDQLVAIDAIKLDMQKQRPMDRLICGDVGFGKTEIAMRAAFKAVDAGYQVAILVPTTILAEQHYRTFSERMREFPFEMASLSRFASKKRQRQIIQRLADGSIDIVIGTHRLAQPDVSFHNLGLLIIDEEQRFGVNDKERLKKIRKTVDVLTMTATPIPRTLHFSLLGIRDISNLETPPEDRRAVETKLVRWDDRLIRTAVLRELNRGGQIFFVHNKVYDIEQVADRLRRIVPEARIGVGHAQMPEHELEQVMLEFVQYKFDLLVATTIIESGLDIPNANTIFIDGADRYGLADLHQLRGRVGRYKNQAYCYLMVDQNQMLNPVAAKRLHAIEEFSHLGAGFALAMRDLEIRGAGNILGTQQSGHIAMVGYEMYCSFLDASVRMLKNLPQKTVIDVELDLPGKAMIPKSYVTDQRMKIDLYRRIVRVVTHEELLDFRKEIEDRFGKPPKPVERLLLHAEIRVDANYWRIKAIRRETDTTGDYIVLDYLMVERIEKLKSISKQTIRIVDAQTAYIPLFDRNYHDDALLFFVKSVLQAR